MQKDIQSTTCATKFDWKLLTKKIFLGFLMGLSDSMVGFSSATSLTFVGWYEKFVSNVRNCFRLVNNKTWLKSFLWILPILLFWIGGFVALTFLSRYMIGNQFGLELVLFFVVFGLSGSYLLYINYRPKISIKNSFSKEFKKIDFSLWWFILGCILATIPGIVLACTGWLIQPANENIVIDLSKITLIVFGSFFAGMAVLIPGLSDSFILHLTNTYNDIYNVAIYNLQDNWYVFLIFVIFMIIGIICSVFIASWLIKKYKNNFYSCCFGLTIFSAVSLIISINPSMWAILGDNYMHILYVFIAIILALSINIGIWFKVRHNVRSEYNEN